MRADAFGELFPAKPLEAVACASEFERTGLLQVLRFEVERVVTGQRRRKRRGGEHGCPVHERLDRLESRLHGSS